MNAEKRISISLQLIIGKVERSVVRKNVTRVNLPYYDSRTILTGEASLDLLSLGFWRTGKRES